MSALTQRRGTVLKLPNPMIFVVWGAIFVPGHLADWWIERGFAAAVFVIGGLTLFAKPAPWETRIAARRAAGFFFLIQFFFIASFVYAIAFTGMETGVRDYFEVVRYLFLWVFVTYVLRHYDDRVREATETAIAASMYWSVLVGFCWLHFVPVLTPFFQDHLYAHTKTFVNYFGTLRLTAPFENPNFLGFYAVQVLTYLLFFSRSPSRLVHIAAALLVIYFTGSRTAWVTAAIALASAFAVYAYLGAVKVRIKFAVQLGLAVFIFAAAGVRYSDKILENSRLQAIFSAFHKGGVQNEANAAGRLEQNLEAWEFFKKSPILGMGPSKYATFDYVDDQYALWFLRNGAIGALLILTGLGYVALTLIRSRRDDALAFVGAGTFVVVVATALLTGEFLNNFRLFYMTWFMGTAIARGRPKPAADGAGA